LPAVGIVVAADEFEADPPDRQPPTQGRRSQ
jgi:hypothetical protein